MQILQGHLRDDDVNFIPRPDWEALSSPLTNEGYEYLSRFEGMFRIQTPFINL